LPDRQRKSTGWTGQVPTAERISKRALGL
jgi:hypothetical protein